LRGVGGALGALGALGTRVRPLVRRPRLRDFPLVRGERKSRFSPDLTKRAKPEGGDLRSSRASEGADPPSEGPRASAEGRRPRPEGAEGAEGATDPPQFQTGSSSAGAFSLYAVVFAFVEDVESLLFGSTPRVGVPHYAVGLDAVEPTG